MMPRIQEQLPHLFELAYDKSEAGRVHLAGQLANLFLTEEVELSNNETELLNALIDDLLSTKNLTIRNELVKRFVAAATLSRPLALRIAYEAADVAREILISNEKLTNDDLISIIGSKGRDHARLIAQRRIIAEAVTDALVTTGDMQVMLSVAENLGARLSAKAVTILADAARITTSLQEPITRRPELTEAQATKLYWWVTQDLRRSILKRFGINANRLTEKLSETIDEKLNAYKLQKNDETVMRSIADWLQERDAISVKLLPQILRLGYFRLFSLMLSRLSGLKLEVVDMVTAEAGGRTLATLCRAIGVDKPTFVSIFLLSRGARPGEHIVHPRELSFALAAFDRLTLEEAHATIHTWKVQTDKAAQQSR